MQIVLSEESKTSSVAWEAMNDKVSMFVSLLSTADIFSWARSIAFREK